MSAIKQFIDNYESRENLNYNKIYADALTKIGASETKLQNFLAENKGIFSFITNWQKKAEHQREVTNIVQQAASNFKGGYYFLINKYESANPNEKI